MNLTARNFRKLRDALCLSQAQMGEFFGKCQSWVSRIEQGKIEPGADARKKFFKLATSYKKNPEKTVLSVISKFEVRATG